ncbi:hypothetical protein [Candidatus Viridilinea mediisalina]|uniref:Uncharacterized protein n=1 Tax=Candidatus Viridilinea mediisalina TaxID=2024553 RepID=A0A2A6RLW4_9CHLR|nr:hypothetical protein [Candidatus Viridilinea mediisalina]PDW03859.1 hypothetical protein CJ255_06820 [Candidatus Viridilinea mediisalina]
MAEREEPLVRLVAAVEQAGLRGPALLFLDLLRPVDLITSNLVGFGRPFVVGTTLEPFVVRLGEAAAWAELRRLLAAQD